MDLLYQILALLGILLPIALLISLFILIPQLNKRSKERLKIDKQNDLLLKEHFQEFEMLKKRVKELEDILEDVK
ncbi:hypothetical protein [Alkalicoccus luteus]|uniref:Phage shock protein B n=1 Tax=Alkalicoccus luteus TaxID=1237094 RepID=A0A969TW23_9BACI|nr:hypothetical protein [Alkalicoccus luteus]NJP38995.1 hypothetical protein [Alkalicoccus luteus]